MSLEQAQENLDQVDLVDRECDDPELPGKRRDRNKKPLPIKSKRGPSPDEIADMATRGEDSSSHFTDQFSVVRPFAA